MNVKKFRKKHREEFKSLGGSNEIITNIINYQDSGALNLSVDIQLFLLLQSLLRTLCFRWVLFVLLSGYELECIIIFFQMDSASFTILLLILHKE